MIFQEISKKILAHSTPEQKLKMAEMILAMHKLELEALQAKRNMYLETSNKVAPYLTAVLAIASGTYIYQTYSKTDKLHEHEGSSTKILSTLTPEGKILEQKTEQVFDHATTKTKTLEEKGSSTLNPFQ
jgi:hypothetical protein